LPNRIFHRSGDPAFQVMNPDPPIASARSLRDQVFEKI
jgi:hypothetical protein